MFTDVELSRQCQTAFSDYLSSPASQQQQQSSSASSISSTVLLGGSEKGRIVDLTASPSSSTIVPMETVTSPLDRGSNDFPSISSSSSRKPIKTEMSIQLLTTGYWPTYPTFPSLILPPELSQLMKQFQNYYDSHFQGRRLTWAHALERCIVIGWFPKKKHELEVSLLQGIVLKCFNLNERLTFEEIK
jgi:hypothetical protein